ncbi:MAG: alpha/beta fold hydrolase [Myxococcaceae bacterium]
MAERIGGASLHVIPEGTHFVAVQRPDLVKGAVSALLERAGY